MARPADGFDEMSPDNVAPLVAWLASSGSSEVTGRVFEVSGGTVTIINGVTRGPARDAGRRWRPEELGPVITGLLADPGPTTGLRHQRFGLKPPPTGGRPDPPV